MRHYHGYKKVSECILVLALIMYTEGAHLFGPYGTDVALSVAQTTQNRIEAPWWNEDCVTVQYAFRTWAQDGEPPEWIVGLATQVYADEVEDDYAHGAYHVRSLTDLQVVDHEYILPYAAWGYYYDGWGLYGFARDPDELARLWPRLERL